MGESPSSALPQLEGLTIEAVEWLPSGADSGLVRVRVIEGDLRLDIEAAEAPRIASKKPPLPASA